jgi:hypothetical protein
LIASDKNNGNKWNQFLAVIFSFIVNFIFLLLAKRAWDRLTVHQKGRLIAGIVVSSWVLFGLMVLASIFFPDEITAIHKSEWRELASAVTGAALAVVIYLLLRKR